MEEAALLLEEQPYVAIRSDSPERPAVHRRRSTMGLGRRSSLIRTPVLDAGEADELILRANDVPDCKASTVEETLQLVKAHEYRLEQFAKLQGVPGMSSMSLRFLPEYEAGYCEHIQKGANRRTRGCFLLGFAGLVLYITWEASLVHFTPRATAVAIGLVITPFVVGFFLTFVPCLAKHFEALSLTVFGLVAMGLIALKPLLAKSGPVIPLLILLIPIFGVARTRFISSCILGWSVFLAYIIVQLTARAYVHPSMDSTSDIFYQGLNYGMMVLGGMVSHYRQVPPQARTRDVMSMQELLRRRNYALQLPFGASNDYTEALNKPKFSKHELLHGLSLEFRHADVEACFLRHWYLIDPFPFESPHSAALHQGMFRVIWFPVATVVINQTFLVIQDCRLLGTAPVAQHLGLGLRFGVVDLAYVSAAVFMFVLGQQYAVPDSTARRSLLATLVPASRVDDVKAAQYFSAGVVVLHATCMAVLFFAVQASPASSVDDVYFMGFINAILYSHRSGLRLRHQYAVATTSIVGAVVLVLCCFVFPVGRGLRYACYIVVVLLLASMISREEELLRRGFFILKSIRSLEFEEWFQTVVSIQGWVRQKLLLKSARARCSTSSIEVPPRPPVDTGLHLSKASKWGMYGECVHVALVALDLVLHLFSGSSSP
ncbi:hypothetical protein ACHHYP_15625 [Achlya hypogyna]|uniref:Transmembrane protein n=1 Tax=Achlya hypogyna TaxID=1202772 RepID=A0A1V9YAF3_ACHHY|nr:hypothetical protein ACHHYP_15625 [Achlya hypogyna]